MIEVGQREMDGWMSGMDLFPKVIVQAYGHQTLLNFLSNCCCPQRKEVPPCSCLQVQMCTW